MGGSMRVAPDPASAGGGDEHLPLDAAGADEEVVVVDKPAPGEGPTDAPPSESGGRGAEKPGDDAGAAAGEAGAEGGQPVAVEAGADASAGGAPEAGDAVGVADAGVEAGGTGEEGAGAPQDEAGDARRAVPAADEKDGGGEPRKGRDTGSGLTGGPDEVKLVKVAGAERGNEVNSVAVSPNGRYLAVGGDDFKVAVLQLDGAGKALQVVAEHQRGSLVMTTSWSPDGRYLAVGGSDKKVAVLQLDGAGRPTIKVVTDHSLDNGPRTPVRSLSWSAGGDVLIVDPRRDDQAAAERIALRFDEATGDLSEDKSLLESQFDDATSERDPSGASFRVESHFALLEAVCERVEEAADLWRVYVQSLVSGDKIWVAEVHGALPAVAWHPTNRFVAVADDGSVRVIGGSVLWRWDSVDKELFFSGLEKVLSAQNVSDGASLAKALESLGGGAEGMSPANGWLDGDNAFMESFLDWREGNADRPDPSTLLEGCDPGLWICHARVQTLTDVRARENSELAVAADRQEPRLVSKLVEHITATPDLLHMLTSTLKQMIDKGYAKALAPFFENCEATVENEKGVARVFKSKPKIEIKGHVWNQELLRSPEGDETKDSTKVVIKTSPAVGLCSFPVLNFLVSRSSSIMDTSRCRLFAVDML